MRVVECDICGETISADSDAELKARLGDHLGSAHDRGTSPEELDELPPGSRRGDNDNAFVGGFRLWDESFTARVP